MGWGEVAALYEALEALQPTPVITLNRAVAVAKTRGEAAALELIEPLAGPLDGYLYFHSTRAGMLAVAGRAAEARDVYRKALALQPTTAERAYLESGLARLGAS